jgi:Bacterial Ig-like domain (group 3)/Lamin Tail Domain/Divergent InlB B-repeat domain
MSNPQSKTILRLALSMIVVFAAIYFSVSGTKVSSAGNPSVVINKYFNSGSTADIVELLVIQNNLDMRGMILKDFSASMANDGGGKYQFTNNALWSSVPSGTLIVLRNNNSAADTTVGGGDFNLDVGLQNTTYFTNAGGTFDIAAIEEVMIKAAGSGAAGVTGSIHALAGGTAGAQFTATAPPKLIATGQSGTNQFVFANNSTQSINDFDGTGATGAATGLTFGAGNNANNTAYINSLRGSTNFTLNVNNTGSGTGTVTSSPAGITCPNTCSASYSNGTSVTLTATAAGGSTFTGWSGDCSGTGPCTVTMNANHSVTATFTAVAQTLNVTKNGTGTGNVTSSPAGINCGATCSATYSNGTVVTLTATADVNSSFTSWSGCDSVSGNTCNVTMNATRNVTATFTSTQRTLSVSRNGTGTGTVTSSPAGINCGSTCTATYTDGTMVSLTATADANSIFAGWSGACSGIGSCVITMNGDKSATATFNFVPPPTTVKISQVYGGGGNSGATYTNDFVELYNSGSTPVVLDGWSVQATSAAGTSWTANGAPTILSGTILPGHYYLVQESQGAQGTTPLPAPDASGVITMSGTNAKVALVANSATLSGSCPLGGLVVDFVGYGSATCAEGNAPTSTLSNTTAAVRRGNGCQDTDNNSNDFVTVGPIPRNSMSPTHSCGGDPTQLSALGIASPDSVDPASETLLTVSVTPATIPASTGITVAADLSSIGIPGVTTFYDDGTNGDTTAGDNVFSYRATVAAATTTGVKNIVATVTDAQARSINEPITLTVQSPTCGVERWSVKVGTDPDASLVDINNPVSTTIADLGVIPAPADPPGPPDNARVAPTETRVYTIYATMTVYKKETDVDYHIVLDDGTGHTMIAEIPSPACILAQNPNGPGRVLVTSPFTQGIMDSRQKFDSRFTATSFFQTANVPVRVTGVGFFDFIHGQTGVAPNGIELHPVLSIDFTANTSTTLMSSLNPSQYGQSVSITATVSNGGVSTPTGTVNFFDGGTPIGTRTLDQNGQAIFESSTLSTGSHSITASYAGDTTSSPSTSAALIQVVNKASSMTTVTCPSSETYTGAAIEPCSAIVTGAGGLNQSVPVTYTDNVNVGVATANASYSGDDNHEASNGSSTFMITKASSTTVVTCPPSQTYTGAAIEPCTASYSGAGGLSGTLTPTYSNNINAGSATASATYGGDANHESSTGNAGFTINKASSTTIVTCPASQTYTGAAIEPCTATATGAGGLNQAVTPVTYANNINVGSATAAATFAGDANHEGSTGNGGFMITKASSTTTVNCPASQTYTGAAIEPCTASYSGVGGLSGTLTPTYLNNTDAGSATASATYGGDPNHDGSTGNGGFTITKASSTTTVNCPATQTYTGAAIEPCAATVTGAGGLNQSVPVTYADNVNVGIATANANYSGDANHDGSTGSGTFMITKASSTTTVNCPASQTYTGAAIEPCTASYSGAGGLSGTLTPTYLNNTDAGSATASATYGGDANHDGSTGNSGFTITKASSTTTVNCPASQTYTGAAIEPCTATVTGAGGLNQSVTVSYTNNMNVGSATASATYGGDANHDGSTGNGGFTITKASSTTTVNCPASQTYTGAAIEPCTATVTGVGGLNQSVAVSYTNNTNAGTAMASATYSGDANHSSSTGNATFTITKATPIITWNNPADIIYGTALGAAQLNATANVPGGFSYTPANGTVLNAGAAQPLLASFTPNDTANYNSTSKNVQINVLKATPSFSNLSSPTVAYGTASTNLSGKISFGSLIPTTNVAITLHSVTQNAAIQAGGNFSSAFATGSLAPGTYSIAYNYAGDSNFNSASGSGTLTVGYKIVALFDQTQVHQSGSTIPIKLAITDVNGNNLSSAGTVVTAVGISLVSTTVYGPVSDSGNSNPDDNFRFNGDSYIFNLKTTGLATGIYNLYFTVGSDPTLHTVQFQIK